MALANQFRALCAATLARRTPRTRFAAQRSARCVLVVVIRHHARAEEALQYSSLIATEELTELLKPASTVPLYQYIPL